MEKNSLIRECKYEYEYEYEWSFLNSEQRTKTKEQIENCNILPTILLEMNEKEKMNEKGEGKIPNMLLIMNIF